MDVAAWLRDLGLERYEAAFRENEIEWALLPKLTSDDLKDLGVSLVGHCRKLLEAIAELSAATRRRIQFHPSRPAPSLTLPSPGLTRGSRGREEWGLRPRPSDGS